MDALHIREAVVAEFDRGARTADILVVLWPDHCKALVSVSGYLIGNHQKAGLAPLPPKADLQWWYQFYFATDRERDRYEKSQQPSARTLLLAGGDIATADVTTTKAYLRAARSAR